MRDVIRAIRAKRGLSNDVEDYEAPMVAEVPAVDDQAAREAAWAAEESAGMHEPTPAAVPVADVTKPRSPLAQAPGDSEMEQLKSMAFGQRGPTMADLAAARGRDADSRMAAGIESSLRDGMATILGTGRGTQVLSPSNEAAGVSKAMAEAGDDRRKSLVDYIKAKREGRAADTAESEAKRKARMDAERMGLDRKKFGYQRTNDAANRGAAERRARIMAAAAKDKAGAKSDMDVKDDVKELAKRVGADPASIRVAMDALDKEILESGGDIPGVGRVDALTPDFLSSDKAISVRNQAQDLVDALLKMQSGSTVSEQERTRKYQSYGIGSRDERNFKTGMQRLRGDIEAKLKATEAGFRPEVVDQYRNQGGTSSADVGRGIQAQPAAHGNDGKIEVVNPATSNVVRVSPALAEKLRKAAK